ncbi:MAG TPA: GGDEF domain-containing protein [Gaiellales bacterium]|nr:GGDEF domain-containing protein [Gaiellales bacterium]
MAHNSQPGPSDRRLMVRSAAAMYAGAAFVGIVEGFTPGGPDFSTVPGFTALGLVPLILIFGHRVPRRAVSGLGLLGVVMIADAIATTHGYGDGAVLYMWPALWVARFHGRRATILVVVGIGVAHAVALTAMPPGVGYFDRWLDVMVSVCIVAAVVRVLTERNDHLVAKLVAGARIDPLTGLLNRRGFDERLEAEQIRARRSPRPLAIVSFDIDHFKRINDAAGHEAGDHVLTRVAALLREHARAGDLVARVGGEEFVVVLPQSDAAGGTAFAERIRICVTTDPPAGVPAATVSAGVAAAHAPSALAELLRASDVALYEAKQAGRNRVVVASSPAAARPAA